LVKHVAEIDVTLIALLIVNRFVHDYFLLVTWDVVTYSVLLIIAGISGRLLEPGPQGKVMEDNGACNSNIQGGGLVGVLGYVDKVVTNVDLVLIKTRAFIAKHEQSVSTEGLLLDWLSIRGDLDATNRDFVVCAVIAHAF